MAVLSAPVLARAIPAERWFGRLLLVASAIGGLAVMGIQFKNHGTIALPFGALSLDAEDVALHIAIALAPGKEADRAEAVVAEHLGRFAFREGELVFAWRRA